MPKPQDEPANVPARSNASFRQHLHNIIFEADTYWGALFDVTLLVVIVSSIIVVCLSTVDGVGCQLDSETGKLVGDGPYTPILRALSWVFTIFFTIEYFLRLYCVRKPARYALSFWGIIDLLSFLPDYLLWFFAGGPLGGGATRGSFTVVRSLRLLRAFRIFKLSWIQSEADDLGQAIWRARAKVVVFLTVVLILVTVVGTIMYEIEHTTDGSQFRSIPDGIYWAIVTMTTVGFGDIVPTTTVGKILSALLILTGYSLIIVPTGFVSAEVLGQFRQKVSTNTCPSCLTEGHDADAAYCKYCGDRMNLV